MLKILISSTCFDLKEERLHLDSSLEAIGHTVILSEADDILYDPRNQTHINCIKAVEECDLIIFLIGSRFGGKAVQGALDIVELERLESSGIDFFKKKKNLEISITQCEILTALRNNIPIYTFIKTEVYNVHSVYEKNKSKGILEKMEFPGFKNVKEAKYIFEFFNFIRKANTNNYFKAFDNSGDITEVMKKQLSMLLSRLLKETKSEVLVTNNKLEILPATVVSHLSTERQKAFDRLYYNLNKGETIKIMGTGVTNFLSNKERIHGYLKDGNTIKLLLVNNEIIKEGLHCTSDLFLKNINYLAESNKVELIDKNLKVHCYLANTNFLIDKNHFNNYHQRINYNEDISSSIGLIQQYQKDIESEKFRGKIIARHFASFTSLSITAISRKNRKKNDLIAEFIIPFTKNRIIFHSTDDENPIVFDLFMNFFDSTWKKAKEII